MNVEWKILDVISVDGQITKVRYQATYENVSTEGYWTFKNLVQGCNLEDVHEQQLVHWLHLDMNEVKDKICENLNKQVTNQEQTSLPWKVETFKVNL